MKRGRSSSVILSAVCAMSLACLGAAAPLRVTEAAAAGSASIPFEKYCDLTPRRRVGSRLRSSGTRRSGIPNPWPEALRRVGHPAADDRRGRRREVGGRGGLDWRLQARGLRDPVHEELALHARTFNGKPREYHSKYMGVDFYIMQLREDRPIDRMAYKRLSAARDAIRSKDFKRAVDQAEEILHSVSSYFELTAASYYLGLAQAGQRIGRKRPSISITRCAATPSS